MAREPESPRNRVVIADRHHRGCGVAGDTGTFGTADAGRRRNQNRAFGPEPLCAPRC